jgi:arabinosaccharide transport system substrate-binding protein
MALDDGRRVHVRVSRREIVKRAGVGFGAMAFAPAVLAACGGETAKVGKALDPAELGDQPITLRAWSFDDLHLKVLKERAAAWNRDPANPRLTLKTSLIPAETATTKLIGALTAGKDAPDIAAVQEAEMPRLFANGLAEQALVPLDDYIEPIRSQFAESKWALYSDGGKTYGIEQTMGPAVNYYREDEFRRLGLPGAIDTMDDWLAAARVARKRGKYIVPLDEGGDTLPLNWKLWFLQAGGNIFDAEGNVILDEGDHATYVTDLYASLIQDDLAIKVPPTNTDAVLAAAYKSSALIGSPAPDWWPTYVLKPTIPDQAGKWRAAPLPAMAGGRRASTLGGGGLCITAQAKRPEAAYAFLHFASLTLEGQIRKWESIQYFPTMKKAWTHPSVVGHTEAFFGDQKIGKLYADVCPRQPVFYTSAVRSEAEQIIATQLVSPVVAGDKQTEPTVKAVADKIRALVKQA